MATQAGQPAAQVGRRLPYGILWLIFIASMVLGAGLFVVGKPVPGAIVLSAPLVAALLLGLSYYLVERGRRA